MPVHVTRSPSGNKYHVKDSEGKVYGTHATKQKAIAQMRAINIAAGYVPGVKPKNGKAKAKRKG